MIHRTTTLGQIAICHDILSDPGPGPIRPPLPGPKGWIELRYTKNSDVIQCAVYNALGVGKQNAISRAELSRITGYKDRRIREAIEAMRYSKVIINLDNGDGYYIPDSTLQGRREAAAWIARQDRRIQSMKAATKGARRFVNGVRSKGIPGQISMFGMGGM